MPQHNPGEQLPNPGDAFFKETFSHRETSENFFQQHLPPVLVKQTDPGSVYREPDSFLDAQLRSRYADMLFSCRIAGQKAFYYVLLEHKSTPEYWTLFHLLELMVRIWRKHLDNTSYAVGRLPMIIPIVLHQGPKGWNHSIRFADYINWPAEGREGLEAFLPKFEHVLVDLSKMDWDEIRGEARLRLALTLMKAVREGRVMEILPKIAPLFAELGSEGSVRHFLQAFAQYMLRTEERVNVSTIYEIADKLPTEQARRQIMTLADYIREEGREEGLERGREEGREAGREEGMLIGQIITAREVLGMPVIPPEKFRGVPSEELRRTLDELRTQLRERLQ